MQSYVWNNFCNKSADCFFPTYLIELTNSVWVLTFEFQKLPGYELKNNLQQCSFEMMRNLKWRILFQSIPIVQSQFRSKKVTDIIRSILWNNPSSFAVFTAQSCPEDIYVLIISNFSPYNSHRINLTIFNKNLIDRNWLCNQYLYYKLMQRTEKEEKRY